MLNLLIVLLHLKQLGLLPLNSYVFLIFIYAVLSNLLIKDYLYQWYCIWHKRLNNLYEQRYLNSNQIRQKYLSKTKRNWKDEKEIEKNMKKKENERMKLMFDLCKTYVTVNVISMSSLCLTYVKLICHNLCNIIVICHKIA